MKITQLSVFIENKPGHLRNILKIIADEKVNILTMTIAETSEFGILRMIVSDTEKAASALKSNSITCSKTDVLAISLEDKPGALFNAVESFAKRDLNIEYMYSFNEKKHGNSVMIFRFEDTDAARNALMEEGYRIITREEIIGE